MTTDSPGSGHPPLEEMLLGVQFRPLPNLKSAHLGAFWRTLGPDWSEVSDCPALGQIIGPFAKPELWTSAGSPLQLSVDAGIRVRIHARDRSRMLQIENGWLVYNWVRSGGTYPRYCAIKAEFDDHLRRFSTFLTEQRLGALRPNLWEIVYVNLIPRGTVWKNPADGHAVLPRLLGGGPSETLGELQSLDGRWTYDLMSGRGYLQVLVGQRKEEGNRDVLVLKLTARGPTGSGDEQGLHDGLETGHRQIVRMFVEITSEQARGYWGCQP